MKIFIVTLFAMLSACGNQSQFKGGRATAEEDTPTLAPQSYDAESNVTPYVEPVTPATPLNAVTEGSFTAYTIPETPQPLQNYTIVIEVRLPSNLSVYDKSDLSGRVIGTDDYTQEIGGSSSSATDLLSGFTSNGLNGESFSFSGSVGTLRVTVPGAQNLVKDTIQIRSSILQESQTLTLEFSDYGQSGSIINNQYDYNQYDNYNSSYNNNYNNGYY
ncbi:hypothetical protein N9D31_00515 [Oligoflexaceae bacterium]|nr:hypothetical protein [Oligoflexaceae bacterium]